MFLSKHLITVLLLLPGAGAVSSADLVSLISSQVPIGTYLCSRSASRSIEDTCRALEATRPPPSWPRDLMVLDGTWKLLYSSALAGPPQPPFVESLSALLPESFRLDSLAPPLEPRDVRQRIDVRGRRCVNSLSLKVGGPASVLFGRSELALELDHRFAVEGEGSGGRRQQAAGRIIDLQLERVMADVKAAGDETDDEDDPNRPSPWADSITSLLPRGGAVDLPAPISLLATGSFDTTYVDGALRISRGAALGPPAIGQLLEGELRVFLREGAVAPGAAAMTWQEEEEELRVAAEMAAAGNEGEDDGGGVPKAGEVGEWEDRWQEGTLGDFLEDDTPD